MASRSDEEKGLEQTSPPTPPSVEKKKQAKVKPYENPPIPNGYRDLAYLMAKKESPWAIFRKFGQLNMLNLLCLQAELIDLQEALRYCCEADDNGESGDWAKRFAYSFLEMRQVYNEDRINGDPVASVPVAMKEQYRLLLLIREKLKEYSQYYRSTPRLSKVLTRHTDEALLRLAELEGLGSATQQNLTCLRTWLFRERQKCAKSMDSSLMDQPYLNKSEMWTFYDMEGLEDLIALGAPRPQRDPFEGRLRNYFVSVYDSLKYSSAAKVCHHLKNHHHKSGN
jgi:hypothetical protein